MSNEKETKRPLDVEEMTEDQIEGVAGGAGGSGSGNESRDQKVRLNSAYVNISDRD